MGMGTVIATVIPDAGCCLLFSVNDLFGEDRRAPQGEIYQEGMDNHIYMYAYSHILSLYVYIHLDDLLLKAKYFRHCLSHEISLMDLITLFNKNI